MKKGFTLAEVLITLTVIGVVAAITMPTLNSNIKEQQVGPKLAKAINILENGNKLMLHDNDARAITSISDCDTPIKYVSDSCIGKYIKGHQAPSPYTARIRFVTNDGMFFDPVSTAKTLSNEPGIPSMSKKYYKIVVDIDGDKGPTSYGKDRFTLYVENKGSVMAQGSKMSKSYGADSQTWEEANNCPNKNISTQISRSTYCAGSIVDNGYKVKYAYSSLH